MIILLWLIGILFGLAFIVGLGILIYLWGKRSTEENPDKALVFELNGRHFHKPYKAIKTNSASSGSTYKYSKDKSIVVPNNIEELYYQGRRFIFSTGDSKIFATSLLKKKEIDKSEKESILEELLASDIGGGAVRAIKGNKGMVFNIALIIIALVIGIAGTYLFTSYQSQMASNQPAPSAPNQEVKPAQ